MARSGTTATGMQETTKELEVRTTKANRRARESALAAATDFLRSHYDQDVSLADAAAAAGVGPRALQLAFQKDLKTTPGNWLLKYRLRRARQILLAAGHGTSVTSAAHESGLHHLGRFSQRYLEEFGEAPSETLKASQKLNRGKTLNLHSDVPARQSRHQIDVPYEAALSVNEKAAVSIECAKIVWQGRDIVVGWDHLHRILNSQLGYKRGAVILKRGLDGRPLIFSHCRGGMEEDDFRLDMNRVNIVLTSARGIVHSVLQEGDPRIENDLEIALDYAALDPSIRSELCVPLMSGGEIIGAINFESDRKNAFDLHDLALATSLSSSTVAQLQAMRLSGNLGLSG